MLRARTRVAPTVARAGNLNLARTLIAQPPTLPNNAPPSPLPTKLKPNDPETKEAKANMTNLVENLKALRAKAREGGGKKTLEKWKAKGQGKLSARER